MLIDMRIDTDSGLLQGARFLPSPNFDARPEGVEPDLIVVHGISLPPGEYGGPYIDQLFTNELNPEAHPYFREILPAKVSAHALISRDGSVTQYVKFADRAWHAGRSRFEDREACNDFSIGIELEGTDEHPYTQAQYASLARLVGALCRSYPSLAPHRVVGHSDVAPGRKTDPGPAFDWDQARRLIQAQFG